VRRPLGLLLALALAAACGGDDAGGDEAAPASTADVAVTEPEAEPDEPAADAATSTTTEPGVPTDEPAGDADGGAADDGLGDAILVADLGPEAEVPGPGADGASGRFEAELVDGALCVDAVVRDLGERVVGAHVHDGPAGATGPVLVDLGDPGADDGATATWTDDCTDLPDDVIERIGAAPEQLYVNVHTASSPDGAVRGQLAVASVFDRTLD